MTEEKEEVQVEEVAEAPAEKYSEENINKFMAELFAQSFIAGMEWGKQILNNMTEEEKEALRKRFNP